MKICNGCGDIWNISQLSGNFKERIEHPCQKPLELIERIVKVCTCESDVLLDLFSGTGTTSLCSKKHGRHWLGFEFDKDWYNVTLDRLLGQPERLDKWLQS